MSTAMENFMRSETLMLEHAFSQIPPKTPNRNSGDVDFNDVFGGPPRRYSTQEARVNYSFGEIGASEDDGSSSPWNGRKEKPVFRVDNMGRSRYPSEEFFDDIFRGDECYCSPRSFDRDGMIASSPSLRIMSPVSKPEFFGTSLPPQLSLTSKSTTARFSPRAPQNHGQFKMDGTANQLDSSRSSSSSRFYHRSPLASFSSEDSSSTMTYDMKDNVENFKKDNKSSESVTGDNQFHFSIYKWAGKGVPMLTPLVDRKKFKNMGKNDRLASSNEKIKGDFTRSKSSTAMNQDRPASVEPESFITNCGSEDTKLKEETRELQYSAEAPYDILESKTQGIVKNSVVTGMATQDVKREAVNSSADINKVNKVENEVPVKPEVKPLRAYLVDEVELSGNIAEIKENGTGAPTAEILNVNDSKNVKKTEEVRIDLNRKDIAKSNLKGVAVNSSPNLGRSGAKGKVNEFVQIFNHEADSRTKPDIPMRNHSHRWKGAGIDQKDNEVNESKVKEKVESNDVEKKPDVSLKEEKNMNKDDARLKPQTKHPSSRKSFRRDSKVSVENLDDPFEDYFSVQELSPDRETVTQRNEVSEEMKVIDAKISQWAVGKKGNIRSLLSTLQFVLWPGNGWKPVALVDLIEANAVKRAYQKALLRLHPDKLQQNSAAFSQKYIAEKVFDHLQEAWDHFNTLAPL